MSNEPAAAVTRPEPPHAPAPGKRWAAVSPPETDYRAAEPGKHACRFPVPPDRRACGRPAVLTRMRGLRKSVEWHYCELPEHSYGCWVEPGPDGELVVLRWAEEDYPDWKPPS